MVDGRLASPETWFSREVTLEWKTDGAYGHRELSAP